jgi:hypothetical protein
MKTLATCALALLLSTPVLAKDGISISFSSEDSRTEFGPRYTPREARAAITTRDGSAVLLLVDDVVALQLSDALLAKLDAEKKEKNAKKDSSFLEDLVLSGVRLAVGKSLEYPVASVRSIDYSGGALRLIGADDKPVFTNVKVNGTDVMHDFSRADVTRFANAVRAARSRK